MNINFTAEYRGRGRLLELVPFGTVVRREGAEDTIYLVTATMDGTGHRALVTLGTGTYKAVRQDTRVIPVDAMLTVGQDLT